MDIVEKISEGNVLRFVVNTNEESLFLILKSYLEENSDVEIVGLYKDHYLIDKTEFYLKIKKGNALTFFKKELKNIKKNLEKIKC